MAYLDADGTKRSVLATLSEFVSYDVLARELSCFCPEFARECPGLSLGAARNFPGQLPGKGRVKS